MRPEIKRLLNEIEENNHKKITVYSLPTCPSCIDLKKKLDKINVQYENVSMEGNEAMWKELKERGGSEYVPQVDVEGYLIKENEYKDVNELISKTLSNMIGRKIVIKN